MKADDTESIKLFYGDARINFIKFEKIELEESNITSLHSHSYYELHFSTKPNQVVSFVSHETVMNKNEFLIIPPGEEHYTMPYKTNTDVLLFTIEQVKGESGFYDYFVNSLTAAAKKSIKASPRLFGLLKSFHESCIGVSVKKYCRMKSLISDIVMWLFDDINSFELDGNPAVFEVDCDGRSEALLERLIGDKRYSIGDIAEMLGYSVRHTTRLINKHCNMTLLQYRRYQSLSAAKKLIKTKKLSMEEVAFLAGFKNANALRAAFMAEENITPTRYRRENKND